MASSVTLSSLTIITSSSKTVTAIVEVIAPSAVVTIGSSKMFLDNDKLPLL